MNAPAAFSAAYSEWKLVKTRSVIQIIFEVPLANHDAAYVALGGMPDPAKERWFGIARLNPTKEVMPTEPVQQQPLATPPRQRSTTAGADKRAWHELEPVTQMGIRCNEPAFWKYLKDEWGYEPEGAAHAAECLRDKFGVWSRKDVDPDAWHKMDAHYRVWLKVPEYEP